MSEVTIYSQVPGLIGGLALLAALAIPGVALLRRFAPEELTAAEQWVYGLPLGVVISSLILLAAACVIGLSLPLVLVIAAAAATFGFVERGRLARPELSISKFAAVVLALFALRWIIFWAGAYRFDEAGLQAGNTGLWADWALHIGDVSSFLYGGNFPPRHPRYVGEPYAYHYLTSVTGAAMATLGAQIPLVLALQSFVFSVLVLLAVFLFARRMSGSPNVAATAVILFFLGGTLGWLLVAQQIDGSHSFWATLLTRPWDGARQEATNFRWQNIYFSLLQPQRSFLYGIPLGLLCLSLLHAATRVRRRRVFVLAGLIAGLLPLANLSTLLSLALITPFLFFLFPSRNWIAFFGAWILLAAPQLWVQQNGGAGAASAFRLQLGWIAPPDPWIWFWIKNAGLFLPLLVIALFSKPLLETHSRRFLFSMMPLFVIANVVVFQPWDWDNTKILLYWYLAGAVFIAALLARGWTIPAARIGVVAVLASIVLSGALANLNQILGKERAQLLTSEELEVARLVRERSEPQSVFAVGLQHNHPVPMLTGRKVVMSYPGWLWSQGYDYSERERDLRAIYALAPRSAELLQRYGVSYVVVGPWERSQLGASPELFRVRYPTLISTANYSVFDVRPGTLMNATESAP